MNENLIAFGILVVAACSVWAMVSLTKPTVEEQRARDNEMFANDVKHVIYNGHQYLWVYTSYGGVVHDPDCKCFLKGEAK